jgi:hypothetical protein
MDGDNGDDLGDTACVDIDDLGELGDPCAFLSQGMLVSKSIPTSLIHSHAALMLSNVGSCWYAFENSGKTSDNLISNVVRIDVVGIIGAVAVIRFCCGGCSHPT